MLTPCVDRPASAVVLREGPAQLAGLRGVSVVAVVWTAFFFHVKKT